MKLQEHIANNMPGAQFSPADQGPYKETFHVTIDGKLEVRSVAEHLISYLIGEKQCPKTSVPNFDHDKNDCSITGFHGNKMYTARALAVGNKVQIGLLVYG